MNEQLHGAEGGSAQADPQRSLREMADAYSRRARRARVEQGKPPVIAGANVLNRIAEIMAAEVPAVRPEDQPAA
jgi:hypothetical protein